MKYNYYSKDEIKLRVRFYVFNAFIWPCSSIIGEKSLQDNVIQPLLMLIIGLGATLLLFLCDTKAAQQLEKIEYQNEKDYASKRTCINIKHNTFIGFTLMSFAYLLINISGLVIEFKIIGKLDFGLTSYVIFTPLVMLITAGITYLYFKIRSNKKEK